jgi:hypothetical protein
MLFVWTAEHVSPLMVNVTWTDLDPLALLVQSEHTMSVYPFPLPEINGCY